MSEHYLETKDLDRLEKVIIYKKRHDHWLKFYTIWTAPSQFTIQVPAYLKEKLTQEGEYLAVNTESDQIAQYSVSRMDIKIHTIQSQ